MRFFATVFTAGLVACGDKDTGDVPADTGRPGADGGAISDGGTTTGGTTDGGTTDGGTTDGGGSDGGTTDGGTSTDADGDGYPSDVDCDDDDPLRNPGVAEVCDDGIDNDCDALVDCEDGSCARAPDCDEDCTNGEDDDFDGLIDCSDDECAGEDVCLEIAERVNGGSLFYWRHEETHAIWSSSTEHQGWASWRFTDLSMSLRWWESSTWQTCRWGASAVTWRATWSSSGGYIWGDQDATIAGSWSDGCGTARPVFDGNWLSATAVDTSALQACRADEGLREVGTRYLYSFAADCTPGWLSGDVSGFRASRTTWRTYPHPKKVWHYDDFTSSTTSATVPTLEVGPWSLD